MLDESNIERRQQQHSAIISLIFFSFYLSVRISIGMVKKVCFSKRFTIQLNQLTTKNAHSPLQIKLYYTELKLKNKKRGAEVEEAGAREEHRINKKLMCTA